ncbi:hypothetical protein F9U39_03710 [Pectobacterium versatile]|uniref:hypothetical protein n=1 Tax=Pectobacterium versatile TaxID=2488639 RepID=UPI001B38C351|nr:hypothetical protein [Pectobacterium versatile]MBQ4788521.1 hypothetical protein [Pectobacterium versatile]
MSNPYLRVNYPNYNYTVDILQDDITHIVDSFFTNGVLTQRQIPPEYVTQGSKFYAIITQSPYSLNNVSALVTNVQISASGLITWQYSGAASTIPQIIIIRG